MAFLQFLKYHINDDLTGLPGFSRRVAETLREVGIAFPEKSFQDQPMELE